MDAPTGERYRGGMSDYDDYPRRRTSAPRALSDAGRTELAIACGIWGVVTLFSFLVAGAIAGIAAILVGLIACGLDLAAVRQADLSH